MVVSTVIIMELDLPNCLVSSVYNQKRAATSNINHIEVTRKLCIFTRTINMTTSSAPFSTSNSRNPYTNVDLIQIQSNYFMYFRMGEKGV